MAEVSSLLSEDQFLCSICLDVFTDPVTTPCGHNFCKACITKHWSNNVQCQCPLCKEECEKKPELRVNTVLSEMAAQFKQSVLIDNSSEEQNTNTGEVFCDFCTETKQKALKSCLDCLISYCETHLEPHRRLPALKRHRLINPVENLESRVCKKHGRPLEQFCKTDQVCVCRFCSEAEHKLHRIVFLEEEYKEKKAELGNTEVQKTIKEKQLKIEEIKQSVKISKENADQETAASMEVYTALIRSVERSLALLLDSITEEHKTAEKQAEGFIKELEEEISELTKRSSELELLSHNEDHLQFIQEFMSLKTAPPTKDWTKVRVHSSYEGILRTSLGQLAETLSKEMKLFCAGTETKEMNLFCAGTETKEMNVKQYWVDVTLDPETAHHKLILSDDGKQVYHGDVSQNVHDSPKRISSYFGVLGTQGFSSGRFYYEVQVEGKTDWVLGVAKGSIHRNIARHFCPQNGFWTLSLRDGWEYKALVDADPIQLVLESKLQKVGVFVDYEQGLVCFYDVDTSSLIYIFNGCDFTEKLYPIFSPKHNNGGKNSSPLVICPLDHTNQTYVPQNSSSSGVNPDCPSGGEAIGWS